MQVQRLLEHQAKSLRAEEQVKTIKLSRRGFKSETIKQGVWDDITKEW
jgi:hypothetical protein